MDELVTVQIAPWLYLPTEPVILVAQDTNTNDDLERLNFTRLRDAVAHFARFHIGPIIVRRVSVVDAEMRVVIGYQHDQVNGLHWFGTKVGFDLLEQFHDRGAVVLWAASVESDFDRPARDVVS